MEARKYDINDNNNFGGDLENDNPEKILGFKKEKSNNNTGTEEQVVANDDGHPDKKKFIKYKHKQLDHLIIEIIK